MALLYGNDLTKKIEEDTKNELILYLLLLLVLISEIHLGE